MNQKIERKRVACLYRVSTKKQIDDGMKIPLQKNECQDFITRNPGWILVKEYEEKGISAYKVKAENRDVLQEAMLGAKKGEFDILLIFKSDRLCRIADENNPTIKAFCNNGVQVWSVSEGNISINSREDSLINYFRGYNNESESVIISERTDVKHRQMVAEGISRGGTLAYGFEYFKNGRYNGRDKYKRKELYDIRINEAEAEVVRDIFNMYVSKGYGGERIAKELNRKGIPTRENKEWKGQNINRMLKNPKYAGFDCYFKTSQKKDATSYRQNKADWVLSPQMPELQIINSDTWNRTEKLIFEKSTIVKPTGIAFPRKGELLFCGLARCGHCGHMLRAVPLKKTWPRKDGSVGVKKIYKYRCYNKTSGGKCSGQTEYGKKKIEEIIMKEVYRYMDNLGEFNVSNDFNAKATEQIKSLIKQIDDIKKILAEANKEKRALDAEIVKAIMGNSSFSAEQLTNVINGKEAEISDLDISLAEMENKLEQQKLQNEDLKKVKILSQSFRNAFDEMDVDEKKMVLKEIISNIFVYRDKIEINMRINISHLSESLRNDNIKKKDIGKPVRVIEGSILTELKNK